MANHERMKNLSSSFSGDIPFAAGHRKTLRLGMVAKVTIAMLGIGLIPLILFGAIRLFQEGTTLRVQARESMKINAEGIAAQLDEWVDKNVRVLKTVAELPGIRSMKADQQVATLTTVQAAYPWMFLIHTVGTDGMDVARNDKNPLTNYTDRKWFQDPMNGKDLTWQTLISRTNGKPSLVIAMPIRDNGAIVGVLQAAMAIEDISRIVLNWRAGSTGYAFLVDEGGTVIAHAREEYVKTQRKLQDHPLVAAFEADGKPHLASFVTSGEEAIGYIQGNRFGWGIAAQQNTSELMAPQRQTLMVGLALLLAAALVVGLIAVLASKLLVRPIVEMTRAAERMSMGELDSVIPPKGTDEIASLAKALERLRRSMVAAMNRL
jgi:methyl-accepting chemotaxis protein